MFLITHPLEPERKQKLVRKQKSSKPVLVGGKEVVVAHYRKCCVKMSLNWASVQFTNILHFSIATV